MINYDKILKKIEQDQKCKPSCVIGPTGPRGIQGLPGPIGMTGDIGPIGPKGEKGDRGDDGTSIDIMGTYQNLDDLLREHTLGNIGDGYLVNGDLYIWSDNDQNWVNAGPVRGPKGDVGPIGPAGPSLIKSAYIVTFNDEIYQDGIAIQNDERLPLDRLELNIGDIVTLNTNENIIKFNEIGYYKISFNVSAYPNVSSVDFNPNTDFVSIGFRNVNTNNIYVGISEWAFNGEAVELSAQGILSINNIDDEYELVNLNRETIYLNTPSLNNITTISYFTNSLITLVVEYLGK